MKAVQYKIFALIFSFAILSSNVFAQDSALKEKIQKMNNQMIKDMLSGNAENVMMKMYADDVISMPSYEPMTKGRDALIKKHKKDKEAGFKMNDMTLNTMEVWSSGDLAYEIGTYTVDMTIPGMDNIKDNGKYLTIWEKQPDNTWKVKAEMWNTDNNPWANMEMSDHDKNKDME